MHIASDMSNRWPVTCLIVKRSTLLDLNFFTGGFLMLSLTIVFIILSWILAKVLTLEPNVCLEIVYCCKNYSWYLDHFMF